LGFRVRRPILPMKGRLSKEFKEKVRGTPHWRVTADHTGGGKKNAREKNEREGGKIENLPLLCSANG